MAGHEDHDEDERIGTMSFPLASSSGRHRSWWQETICATAN